MNSKLENYIGFMSFISKAIGPDYELYLLDTRGVKYKKISLEYGEISDKNLGDDLPPAIKSTLAMKEYEHTDYIVNRTTYSKTGKALRTSMYFIKSDKGDLEGIMCINFDDSRYEELGKQIMYLCHPDEYIEERISSVQEIDNVEEGLEYINQGEKLTMEDSIMSMIDVEIKAALIPVERLTPDEKVQIVKNLDSKGFFMLKGAVSILSNVLDMSQASVYRYINMARDER
ncbi:MAG: PAS domain-containing protein [Bacillota bacterium]|nr:PAS domain-containing protein [Bacillota bacterium]